MRTAQDLLRRQFEAYAIGRLADLRVHLQFFVEEMGEIPESVDMDKFDPVTASAVQLLSTITENLNGGMPTRSLVVIDNPEPVVTEAMVTAAVEAMPWEGSSVSPEETERVMRAVLQEALSVKKDELPPDL